MLLVGTPMRCAVSTVSKVNVSPMQGSLPTKNDSCSNPTGTDLNSQFTCPPLQQNEDERDMGIPLVRLSPNNFIRNHCP